MNTKTMKIDFLNKRLKRNIREKRNTSVGRWTVISQIIQTIIIFAALVFMAISGCEILISMAGGGAVIVAASILTYINSYIRNKPFSGKFIHCDPSYKPIIPTGKKHFSIIKINLLRPNVLIIKSHDFNRDNSIWTGEIIIDSQTNMFGMGSYKYHDGKETGTHNIVIYDKDVIFVRILSHKNDGSPQLWVREGDSRIKEV